MDGNGADDIVRAVSTLYHAVCSSPPLGQHTVLAAVVLSSPLAIKILSLATGSKCLPTSRLPSSGNALHDSHAEVLARRGSIRWFLEEVIRLASGQGSDWITERSASDGKFDLKGDVRIQLYISTIPCGDASTRLLASSQDAAMAALKDSSTHPTLPLNATARGRDNYSLYGVLRTKPGRADSPPTLCMSCSDKIAAWNVLGFQGALASLLLGPLYISNIIIGEVPEDMRLVVQQDCERAFWKRLESVQALPRDFGLHIPTIHFTSIPFPHSRSSLLSNTLCNESQCWIADSLISYEVIINGFRRGVPPKHRHLEKFRPLLSKIALFQLYHNARRALGLTPEVDTMTFFEAKQSATAYQMAKKALTSKGCPFEGWMKSGREWESFDKAGTHQVHTLGETEASDLRH